MPCDHLIGVYGAFDYGLWAISGPHKATWLTFPQLVNACRAIGIGLCMGASRSRREGPMSVESSIRG